MVVSYLSRSDFAGCPDPSGCVLLFGGESAAPWRKPSAPREMAAFEVVETIVVKLLPLEPIMRKHGHELSVNAWEHCPVFPDKYVCQDCLVMPMISESGEIRLSHDVWGISQRCKICTFLQPSAGNPQGMWSFPPEAPSPSSLSGLVAFLRVALLSDKGIPLAPF